MKKISLFKKSVLILFAVFTAAVICSCKKPAKPMTIELKANASTGYHWEYTESEKGVVEITGEYIQDESPEGFVGVGGKQIYTVTPLKEGEVTLRFEYQSPGENKAGCYVEYELTVDKSLNITETHEGDYTEE